MSAQIDDLLQELEDKEGEIEVLEEKLEDNQKEEENLKKTLKGKKKTRKVKIINKEENKIKEQIKEEKQEKAKMRKELAKLEKQAGKETNKVAGKGPTAKAKGTGGGNKDGVRCYIRYNNAGNPYRICNDKVGKEPPKPKSTITEPIDPSEFAEKYGGYSNLSDEQTATYHRLYMARQRLEERKMEEGGEDLKALIVATKQKAKEVKKLEKLEKEQKKLQKKENKRKYQEEYKKLSRPDKRKNKDGSVSLAVKALQEKYGITKKQGKTLQQNTEQQVIIKANIKTLEEQQKELLERDDVELDEKTGKIIYVPSFD